MSSTREADDGEKCESRVISISGTNWYAAIARSTAIIHLFIGLMY